MQGTFIGYQWLKAYWSELKVESKKTSGQNTYELDSELYPNFLNISAFQTIIIIDPELDYINLIKLNFSSEFNADIFQKLNDLFGPFQEIEFYTSKEINLDLNNKNRTPQYLYQWQKNDFIVNMKPGLFTTIELFLQS